MSRVADSEGGGTHISDRAEGITTSHTGDPTGAFQLAGSSGPVWAQACPFIPTLGNRANQANRANQHAGGSRSGSGGVGTGHYSPDRGIPGGAFKATVIGPLGRKLLRPIGVQARVNGREEYRP